MTRDDAAPATQACPEQDDLAAFNRGRLTLEKLESIAEHLSACKPCASSLQGLQGEDTVVGHLRRGSPCLPVADEAVCLQLEHRARAIPSEQTATPTVSDAAPAGVTQKPLLPSGFGAYLLLEHLGQGGMGVVYKAQQESLNRPVALKMVRTGIHASAEERVRFRREGKAIARVRHPHVVQIFELGEHAGQPFFSMELLEGGTLADKVKGRPLPQREAAELVRSLAQAVQAAHQQGVVHRDLKPSNVLFAADGMAKITDFGLAKVLGGEDSQTQTDAILGTPAYMAPEQARGDNRSIGPATDVHALGAILYECLAGRPPFRAESRYETMELVRTGEPEPPSRQRPELARDLEAICLKCLEKEPARRYGSAEELADDLQRWLSGEPTQVRPPGRMARVGRRLRRRPRTSVALALLAVLALVAALVWHYLDPQRPLREIERRLERGESVTLIGPAGVPRWSRYRLGGDSTQQSEQPDGAFALHTWGLALLELVRDPRRDSFRFRAEVRQDNSADRGEVGLYIAFRDYPAPRGQRFSFLQWTFNDINSVLDQYNSAPAPIRKVTPPPQGNPVSLQTRLLAPGGPQPLWERRIGCAGGTFGPAGYGKTDWRQVVVEVTPQEIRAFLDGQRIDLTRADLVRTLRDNQDAVRKDKPDEPFVNVPPADFAARGALGLYIHRGSASFRQVVVEPLDQPE